MSLSYSSSRQRSLVSLSVALIIHGVLVFLVLHHWHQVEVAEPLKDITSMVRVMMPSPVQEKPQAAPELAALTPVQKQPETIQAAPAAPRKAVIERKAHKAVSAKPKPNVPASTAEQMASDLPIAPQQPQTVTPSIVTGQSQASADVIPSPNLSASVIQDIAAAYRSMVHGRIAALQQYPTFAKRMGEEGTVLVRFTILASGKISQVVIMESSGSQSLDAAAVDIFMQGLNGHLPSIPPELNKSEWTLSLPIRYQLQ